MRLCAIPLALISISVLVSCAAPSPEPTPTTSANEIACVDFEEATISWLNTMTNDDGTINDWDEELVAIDGIALRSEGIVQERMLSLVETAPKPSEVYIYEDARDEVNDLIEAIARACEADGAPISPNTFLN